MGGLTIRYINALTYRASDIIKVNDITKSVEEEMKSTQGTTNKDENIVSDEKTIEKKYNCKIIKRDSINYSNELNQAIEEGDVVVDYFRGDTLVGKIIIPANADSFLELKRNLIKAIIVLFVVIFGLLLFIVQYLYMRIIRPFHKLENFAERISVGNLEVPLTMDQHNYFGAFTESFDRMREELSKSKQAEYEANRSKKELVASLSHDIKTPVATIKALCEILEYKQVDNDTLSKIHTINQKSDVIDTLINNLFHATLEELEALRIEPKEELSTILKPMFLDINHYDRIHFQNEVPGCLIYCDKLRLGQVIDNVINNSYKYAATNINVTFEERESYIEVEIRDFGVSSLDEDIPLLFRKYYRGKNAGNLSGTGLGLYLAKQFMEGMGGKIECFLDHGFVVQIMIRKV